MGGLSALVTTAIPCLIRTATHNKVADLTHFTPRPTTNEQAEMDKPPMISRLAAAAPGEALPERLLQLLDR